MPGYTHYEERRFFYCVYFNFMWFTWQLSQAADVKEFRRVGAIFSDKAQRHLASRPRAQPISSIPAQKTSVRPTTHPSFPLGKNRGSVRVSL